VLDFLNPALLLGGLLFLVPLVIHLLNRQRFKRRPWAAMEFLLAAYKKQRRRLRRENLLLLLLRCLIPIVLAIAIARPLFRSDALPSALGGSNSHHILVLDATGSMGMELVGATTPFERARAVASALLDRIRARESAPRVSLIVQGLRATQPIRDSRDCRARSTAVRTWPRPCDWPLESSTNRRTRRSASISSPICRPAHSGPRILLHRTNQGRPTRRPPRTTSSSTTSPTCSS
jgi:hypothetical protein